MKWIIVLAMTWSLFGMDLEEGKEKLRTHKPKEITLKTLHHKLNEKKRTPSQFRSKLHNSTNVLVAPDVFIDYMKRRPHFDEKDTQFVPALLKKLRKSNPKTYTLLAQEIIDEWIDHNSPVSSQNSVSSATHLSDLDVALLHNIKNEQYIRLEHLRNEHEKVLMEKKHERRKSCAAFITALISTTTAIIEAILLGYKAEN